MLCEHCTLVSVHGVRSPGEEHYKLLLSNLVERGHKKASAECQAGNAQVVHYTPVRCCAPLISLPPSNRFHEFAWKSDPCGGSGNWTIQKVRSLEEMLEIIAGIDGGSIGRWQK